MSGPSVAHQVGDLFGTVGAKGFLLVREIGHRDEVGVDADTPVVLVSVFKILVAVAFSRAVSNGDIDAAERAEVPARYRVGGAGTAGCLDPIEMSLRDLALFMMTMSDNAATNVVYQRVGKDAIDAVVGELGLSSTFIRGRTEHVQQSIILELGLTSADDLDTKMAAAGDAVWNLAAIDPGRTNASTPRDIASLLESIWTDQAAPPDACAFVRSIMSQQIFTHRLTSGFEAEGVQVTGKTGTLPSIRKEAGVVTYPDGRQYVAAVFTRATSLAPQRSGIDASIGHAARTAIEYLRARRE